MMTCINSYLVMWPLAEYAGLGGGIDIIWTPVEPISCGKVSLSQGLQGVIVSGVARCPCLRGSKVSLSQGLLNLIGFTWDHGESFHRRPKLRVSTNTPPCLSPLHPIPQANHIDAAVSAVKARLDETDANIRSAWLLTE